MHFCRLFIVNWIVQILGKLDYSATTFPTTTTTTATAATVTSTPAVVAVGAEADAEAEEVGRIIALTHASDYDSCGLLFLEAQHLMWILFRSSCSMIFC